MQLLVALVPLLAATGRFRARVCAPSTISVFTVMAILVYSATLPPAPLMRSRHYAAPWALLVANMATPSSVTSWSYSRFALYSQCPFKFKLEVIDKLKVPASPAMERGNRIHKALASYLTGTGDLPKEIKHPFQQKLYTELRSFDDKIVEQQWGFTYKWEPTGWFAKDTWFRSVLDAAVLYEDSTAEIIDHKSGKKYGSNSDQMELFAIALFCHFKPATHVTTRLIYFDSGDEDTAEYPRTVLPFLQAKWNDKVAPMFADQTFAPRPNDKCRFCAFNKGSGGPCQFG